MTELNNELSNDKMLVHEVLEDFKQRQINKRAFESTWQLNINFLLGNQYCFLNGKNDLIDEKKQFFWQEREVFNHIAPIVDLRMSKLAKIRPALTIVPFSDDPKDIACAKVSKNLIKSISYDLNLNSIIAKATMWSEITGTSFYKVSWNAQKGRLVSYDENGAPVYEGEAEITAVSPFEIYPDSNTYSQVDDCKSIIHARAYHVDEIKNIWGVDVKGDDIDVFSLESITNLGGLGYQASATSVGKKMQKNHAVVIERYEAPSVEFPNGRLVIVAGERLIHVGELPYENQLNSKRGFPFIKQCCLPVPNSFWGTSIIERCIPVQRAYNAVKNRKHEFLNRISMGVLAVEDGSVDIENLEDEGLCPGKILVYRQGATQPKMLASETIPASFENEEDRLLEEFLNISGVSDMLTNHTIRTGNISGVALQLLMEQDEERILTSADEIKSGVKEIAKHILRLYKQFAVIPHTSRLVGENGGIEMFYWKNSDITSEDVVFETENELTQTVTQKRSFIYDLLNTGLLQDESGKMTNSTKQKVLEQLGFGIWDNTQDLRSLQTNRANDENYNLIKTHEINAPMEIDDHNIHINEHVCFMLGKEFEKAVKHNPDIQQTMLAHIREHKKCNNQNHE